jgi:Bacterial protein of unknown function (DUF937)
MAINLPALVMRVLTPEMIARIASALGIDRSIAQTAINAAVPSLLAGFSNVAAQPGGPQRLATAAAQQTGTLDSFSSMLGSQSQSSFVERGSNMLSSLLDGGGQNALAGAISKFTGIGQNAAAPLLGMLTPVVMHTIGQQQGATGAIDPTKIASLLASQKDNIAAAMPAGLGNLLSGTGLLDSLGGATRMANAASGEAARVSAFASREVTDAGRRAAAARSNNWIYWLVPAAAVAALLVYVVSRPAEDVVPQQRTTAAQTTGVQSAAVAGIDVGKQFTDSISSLRTTLAGIGDATSAQAALPKLQEAAAQIDKVSDMTERLPADQRKLVAGLATSVLPSLNQLFDKVLAVPGVSDDLKPSIEALRRKLAGLAT